MDLAEVSERDLSWSAISDRFKVVSKASLRRLSTTWASCSAGRGRLSTRWLRQMGQGVACVVLQSSPFCCSIPPRSHRVHGWPPRLF